MNKRELERAMEKHFVNVDGQDIAYHNIGHDINGNPRKVVHFLDLGIKLDDYGKVPGLTKYRAKWFGGGYVLESCYNVHDDLKYTLDKVEEFYKNKK